MYIKVSTVFSSQEELESIRKVKPVSARQDYDPEADIDTIVEGICNRFMEVTHGVRVATVYISFMVLPEDELIIAMAIDKKKQDSVDCINKESKDMIIRHIEQALVRRHPDYKENIHRFCWEEVDD